MLAKPLKILGVLGAIALVVWAYGWFDLALIKRYHLSMEAWVSQNFWLTWGGFIFIYIVVTALSMPVSGLLSIAAGVWFGKLFGFLAVQMAACIGAAALYWIIIFSTHSVSSYFQHPKYDLIQKKLSHHALGSLFLLRLLPIFPFVLVSALGAWVRIPFLGYLLVTCVGIIPGVYLNVSIGTMLEDWVQLESIGMKDVLTLELLLLLLAICILGVGSILFKRWMR